MTVNGTTVVIPRNTIVVVSATNVSWQELWSLAPCPWGLGHAVEAPGTNGTCAGNTLTGLALSDIDPGTGAKPLTTFEINIMGNRIGSGGTDMYVAGLVYLAQQSLNLGQGIINYIDLTTATMHVGCSPLGTPCPAGKGARVQINDPVGRYGRQMSPDPRFTGDTDNPTISSQTAYPMCIPRYSSVSDPACPLTNRPLDPASTTGAPLGNFTLCNPNPVLLPGATTPTVQACVANRPPAVLGLINAQATVDPNGDSTLQAPFMVGDYIEYSGNLNLDSTGLITGVANGQYISAWQIIDKVGIYTSPRTTPAYVNIQLILLGVGGVPITSVPEELTTRIRARGFFTDPTRTVDVFATKVDPCTGVETDFLMLANIPNQKGGVPWGRWREFDQAGLFPVTKQWRIRYSSISTDPVGPLLAANNLTVMQFQIPVAEYITPENLVFGDPTLLAVPNNFQDFPFLLNGMGPWRGDPNNIVGQLAPFPLTNSIPGLTPLAPTGPTITCGPPSIKPPTVIISPLNQTVQQNHNVTLDASQSTDPQGQALTFSWVQTGFGGLPPVTPLSNANTATASFKAPNVLVDTPLLFQVNVTNTANLTSAGSTEIMVKPGPVAADTVTITGATYRSNTGVLNVSATSSDITCSAILTLTAFASSTVIYSDKMSATNIGVGGCSYSLVSGKSVFPTPTSVTVQSSEFGFAACPSGTCAIKFR